MEEVLDVGAGIVEARVFMVDDDDGSTAGRVPVALTDERARWWARDAHENGLSRFAGMIWAAERRPVVLASRVPPLQFAAGLVPPATRIGASTTARR